MPLWPDAAGAWGWTRTLLASCAPWRHDLSVLLFILNTVHQKTLRFCNTNSPVSSLFFLVHSPRQAPARRRRKPPSGETSGIRARSLRGPAASPWLHRHRAAVAPALGRRRNRRAPGAGLRAALRLQAVHQRVAHRGVHAPATRVVGGAEGIVKSSSSASSRRSAAAAPGPNSRRRTTTSGPSG